MIYLNETFLPRIKYVKGNIYVEYKAIDPNTGKAKAFRITKGFKDISPDLREYEALKICHEITKKLAEGWSPFDTADPVQTSESLSYHGQRPFHSKKAPEIATLRRFLVDFLSVKSHSVRPKSLQTYKSRLRAFLSWCIEKEIDRRPVSRFSKKEIHTFLIDYSDRGDLSVRTVDKTKQMLYSFFEYMIDFRGVQMQNPVSKIKERIGKIVDYAPAGISSQTRAKILKVIQVEDPQLALACSLMFYAGIRPGREMLGLKCGDIDLDGATVYISSENAKNACSETIHIPRQLVILLRETWLIEKYPIQFFLLGKNGVPGSVPLSSNSLRVRHNNVRKRLQLPDSIKLYSWKHAGAQAFMAAGGSPQQLQYHLRHKSIEPTIHYIRKRIGANSHEGNKDFPDI